MPIGKIQRKPSNETLSSLGMDSTIDSRISSTDVPKMELLKVNYVQQCKEALMQQKPIEPPAFLAHLQSHQQNLRQSSAQRQEYKSVPFKRTSTQNGNNEANVTKITLGTRPVPPPPPPVVESWKLLQSNKEDPIGGCHENSCCNASCSCSSDSDQGTDSTMSPGCERSNSWNYRTKCTTRDIRRDIARAGIKSRADRIARIEHTECDHRRSLHTTGQRASMPTTPTEAVSKINKIFENAAKLQQQQQHQQQQQQQQQKYQLHKTPPQPSRPAPIPRKEPNVRHRIANRSPLLRRRDSGSDADADADGDCCGNCKCSKDGCDFDATRTSNSPAERPCSVGNRYRDARFVSRIPKPINEHGNRSSTASAMLFNEANEQLQRRIKQMFERESSTEDRCHYAELQFPPKKTPPPTRKVIDFSASSDEALPFNELLRPGRQAATNYQKMKLERVHIRKKRQPLLIINQLKSADETPKSPLFKECPTKNKGSNEKSLNERNSERRTCGYKNCNFANCPMSAKHDEESTCEIRKKDSDKTKRLSLESNSDSGVSTSHDAKEQMQLQLHMGEHNHHSRKSTETCGDCVKVLHCKTSKSKSLEQASDRDYKSFKLSSRSSHSPEPDKLKKLDSNDAGNQIKIHVGKTTSHNADPNDVQNFAKKNLTKTTTDEMLTAALNNSASKVSKSKECNIENDRKNNLRQRTTIKIDDDWVQEPFEAGVALSSCINDDLIETDSLMPTPALSTRKPINANDNCVKIFVRSSMSNGGSNCGDGTRASSVSANSYASRTSGCSSISSHSSTASSSVTSAISSSASTSASTSTSTSLSAHDTEPHDCCTHTILTPPISSGGVYFNTSNSCIHLSGKTTSACNISQRACPPSPISSIDCSPLDLRSTKQRKSNKSPKIDPLNCCSDAVDGVFWNNSYFCNNHPDDDGPCCCSLSSCDDDNCSYYDGNNGGNGSGSGSGSGSGIGAVVVIESSNYRKEKPRAIVDRMDGCERRFNGLHPLQRSRLQQELRMSSAEEILIRNKKLLRKTDVIHELRPRSMDGVADSGVSLSGDTGSSPDSSEHMQNQQQDSESRRLKRGHVLTELLETERIYVSEMSSILKGYCDQMQSEEMMHLVPASLQGKEDLLFGNLHELYTFHNEIFLKDLENCISTTELVALCFVQRRDTFYRLYSFYCQNIPRSERLRETLVDTHLFLQECQKRLGHKLPLGAYLLKPVQRITKYQLLLKDLLRFSDSGNCTKELQKALDCMLIVLKCVNDSMHQVAITGFPTDLAQQGELLLQDSFQVWTESKKDIRLRIKPQQRHIFLYQKSMLFCKQTSKPGHNKSTYQFKHHVKMSQIGLTESVRGDTKRFEVWLQGRQEVHTLQAPTLEIKNKWVAEIKRVLLNQLEELKGEKIKQYGLNHRGLKQTTSWDTPNILLGTTTQRTISCDASSESSNRNSNCSGSSGDDNCSTSGVSVVQAAANTPATLTTASNSSAATAAAATTTTTTTEKEQHEACGWSSDYSNSEDEMSIIEDNSTPGSKFIALADYVAMGHSEVSMREGETVELLKVGCAGWWFVRNLDTNAEGWTPAAYLESLNRRSSRSSSRNLERFHLSKATE